MMIDDGVLYKGFPRSVWIGAWVGGWTFVGQHIIFSFLMFSLTLWSLALFYLLPLISMIVLLAVAHQGIKATTPVVGTEPKGSWGIGWLVFCGFLCYQSWLWGVQSFFKQAVNLTPHCIYAPKGLYVNPDSGEVRKAATTPATI